MGLRDDIEDAPGKEPVRVEMTITDEQALSDVNRAAISVLFQATQLIKYRPLSAPVEAALHDFALGLDELIKETLNKVHDDD